MDEKKRFCFLVFNYQLSTINLYNKGAMTMKFVRYESQGKTAYGILDDNKIFELEGDIFGEYHRTGKELALDRVKLLAPCQPSKVLAVGLNYKSHLGERPAPANPEIFIKTPSCLLEPFGEIMIPREAEDVHYEGELVAVIKKRAKGVSPEQAPAYIFGVSCGNDVSMRRWQRNDLQWWRAKSSDTFGPLGPCIVTEIDYGNLHLETRLNGKVVQSQTTADLLFKLPTLVSFISQVMTLLPGDLIFTGTPGTTAAMKDGDVVEVEVEKIGILKNFVKAERR
jgi:2-keto-4-pentenoate hydratase/2-oxohepta-3-ene-1,7-dioic acid hydratase in catechol pathway